MAWTGFPVQASGDIGIQRRIHQFPRGTCNTWPGKIRSSGF